MLASFLLSSIHQYHLLVVSTTICIQISPCFPTVLGTFPSSRNSSCIYCTKWNLSPDPYTHRPRSFHRSTSQLRVLESGSHLSFNRATVNLGVLLYVLTQGCICFAALPVSLLYAYQTCSVSLPRMVASRAKFASRFVSKAGYWLRLSPSYRSASGSFLLRG